MRWPKRFKLHEAAAPKPTTPYQCDVIQAHGDHLVATFGAGLALVPIVRHDERAGADLPRLERGEADPEGLLPPKAVQEASQGSTGEGRLVVVDSRAVEAQRAEDKPRLLLERPPAGSLPPYQGILDTVDAGYPTEQVVEVCLDAELLVRLSRAIGATEAVRLRFLVDSDGRCGAEEGLHGLIDVRDAHDTSGGPRAVLGAYITRKENG